MGSQICGRPADGASQFRLTCDTARFPVRRCAHPSGADSRGGQASCPTNLWRRERIRFRSATLAAIAILHLCAAPPALADQATTIAQLHAFATSDGANPYAGLVQASDGFLYGVAYAGGANGFGTVYRIDPAGTLTTIHHFTGADGANPSGTLTVGADDALYGTTIHGGGPSDAGTVFRVDLAGVVTTLHTFVGTDGANPESSLLLAADGNLYGTTTNGGSGSAGTIFRITTAGVFTTVHTFISTDGALPIGALIQTADANIYGTTYLGGVNSAGTIYKIDAVGLTTLYAFSGAADGAFPVGGLLRASDGFFYGTTTESGVGGGGTLYRFDGVGALTVLRSFSGTDGSFPEATLVESVDGNIYGTTFDGGASNLGTIFRLDQAGVVTTVHEFNGTDGANPYARLRQGTGFLFGTTNAGGAANVGTVFRLPVGTVVVTLVPASASGPFAGVTTFSATLTTNGQPAVGYTISFTRSGVAVGSAVTNASGVATVAGVSLAGLTVGTYPNAVGAAFVGAPGLAATSGTATLQVVKAVPALTWATPAPIMVGTALGPMQLNATANVPGTFAYNPAAGTVLPLGTQTLSAIFTPTDTVDYTSPSIGVSLQVVPVNHAPVLVSPGPQTNTDGSAYAFAVLTGGPRAYWRLGETTGITAADTAGTNPATRLGGVTFGQPGALAEANSAMRFDGSTGYLSIANSPALQMAGDLTIELWVNVSLATRQTLVSKDYAREFELTLETNGALNLYQGTGTIATSVASPAGAVVANTWQHIIVARAAASKTVAFYVNGVQKGTGAYALTPAAGTRPVYIGRSTTTLQYVNGWIDEVALYPAALGGADAAAHYAQRPTSSGPAVALQLVASDVDGDTLTYSASGLPPGLTLNTATGLISGTLTAAGSFPVTATASDGSLSQSQSFTWTVTHLDRAPALTGPANRTNAENTVVSLQLSATDPDGDPLTYSAISLPASLTLNAASGLISGTLSYFSAGTYLVAVTASDGTLTSSRVFSWTVTNVNRSPVLTNPGAQTSWDASGYGQAVVADGAVAFWRLDEASGTVAADSAGANSAGINGGVTLGQPGALADLNAAMLFNGSTGYVRAVNSASLQRAGDLTLELWVNVSLATRQTLISKDYLREFELTLETSGHLNFYQGNGTVFEHAVSVAGAVTAGTWQHVVVTREAATKTIRFYVNGVDKGSGTYVNPPVVGTKGVSIGHAEGGAQYVNGRLDEVAVYNKVLTPAQIATHYGRQSATGAGTVISLQLVASDPDGEALTYSATGLPPGLTVNASTGLISGTLSSASAGTFQVSAKASDGSLFASQAFTWTVLRLNRAPSLTNPGPQSSTEGAAVTLPLTATDPDGDTLSYSAISLPPGLALNAATGVISGTLTFTSAGVRTVTATVSDGRSSSSQTFTWTIANVNGPPTLTNPGAQTHNVTSYLQSVLGVSPAAYWRLGESSGTTAASLVGATPGVVTGGVTLGQAGALADGNTAMRFDGLTGYVQAADAATLRVSGNLTIELWLNVSLATRQTLVSKSYLAEYELTLETTGHLNFYDGNGTTFEHAVSTAGAVAANTWQHVVVTREAATKTVRFYVNGVAKGSGIGFLTPATSVKPLSIGRATGGAQYVNGRLDEVAIYPSVLTAAQAASHYAARTFDGTGLPVSLPLTASDPDGDALTYSATGLPPGLTINPVTGLISGTLTPASAGSFPVTVTVSDGSLSTTQNFTWTVTSGG